MALFQRTALGVVAALALAGAAQAQSAGSLIARIGATQITPHTKSADLTSPAFPGTQATIGDNTQPTAGLTWMATDQIAIDLPLAMGFKHKLYGAGAIAGVGEIGEVKALPVTLLVQWRFLEPGAKVRPYIGLGPTYAKFYKARSTAALTALTGGSPSDPTTLKMDSKFTVSAQLGASVALTEQLGLDLTVLTTPLKTRATLSTGQTLDAKVDPTTVSVGLSWKF